MDSTASASLSGQLQQISSGQSTFIDPTVAAQMWLGRLDLYSAVFLGVCGIILTLCGLVIGFTVYLTWNHNRQKKEAEKQLGDIKQTYDATTSLYEDFKQIMREASQLLETINKTQNQTVETTKQAMQLLQDAKKKGVDVNEIVSKMKQLNTDIERNAPLFNQISNQFSTISGASIPTTTTTWTTTGGGINSQPYPYHEIYPSMSPSRSHTHQGHGGAAGHSPTWGGANPYHYEPSQNGGTDAFIVSPAHSASPSPSPQPPIEQGIKEKSKK